MLSLRGLIAAVALALMWIAARGPGHGLTWMGALTLAGALGYVLAVAWFCLRLGSDEGVCTALAACLLFGPPLAPAGPLFRLNPDLANAFVLPVLAFVQPVLLPMAILAVLVCSVSFLKNRDTCTPLWGEKRPGVAAGMGLVATVAALDGWPRIAWPLFFAACGAMAAVHPYARSAWWARAVLLTALSAIGIEFLFSLNLQPL